MAERLEEPHYDVEYRERSFEIRRYGPRIVAETQVPDPHSADAYRRITSYFFGGNSLGTSITMTTPQSFKPDGDAWTVWLTLPGNWRMDAVADPLDARVEVREIPAGRVATVRFGGTALAPQVGERTAALEEWMKSNGLSPAGPPEQHRFDPPGTPGSDRRNEVWVPILD
jgi:hypothetical protein